jgi:hypothetical protein
LYRLIEEKWKILPKDPFFDRTQAPIDNTRLFAPFTKKTILDKGLLKNNIFVKKINVRTKIIPNFAVLKILKL